MEGLHLNIKKVVELNVIKGAHIGGNSTQISHLVYADDALIVLEWDQSIRVLSGIYSFTYLDIPLGSNMNLIANWNPLIKKFKKGLSMWQTRMLSYGGRLTFIKSILGSIGIYYLSKKTMSWVNWDSISSLDKGDLSIGSLEAFNLALMFKWIWSFYTQLNYLRRKVILSIYGPTATLDNVREYTNGIWIN
ncbi:uncharacterized protein [Rutidosis leptorrhynchoides]|uniref:uncharacterized protein n=1 Tax=Rutidosis leptorrhynchoides TaxID=125765 RepID=UPI003A999F42